MSFDPLVEAHLDYMRQCGKSERTIYQRNRSLILAARVLPVPLIEATKEMLASWRAGLTCGEEAIKHYVGDARQFYNWAIDAGLRDDNPAAKLPVPPIGRRLPRPISEEDLLLALTAPPARVRPWLVLAAGAGLRAKEIAFLRRQHVLESHLPPLLFIARDATKGSRERIVNMSDWVIEELHRHGMPKSGFLFPRADSRPGPNRPHMISLRSNTYLHELGIPDTLHQLRHRFGTMLYRETHDIRLVQEQMGHASSRSTDGYTAYDQADAATAVQALRVGAPRLKSVS